MPVHFRIEPSNRLVITTCYGDLTFAEIAACAARRLKNDRGFDPGFRHLNDLSQVTSFDVNFRDVGIIRDSVDPFSSQSQRAFVAPGRGVTFGLARMYEIMLDSPHFKVVPSLVEGRLWLGLEAPVSQGFES